MLLMDVLKPNHKIKSLKEFLYIHSEVYAAGELKHILIFLI